MHADLQGLVDKSQRLCAKMHAHVHGTASSGAHNPRAESLPVSSSATAARPSESSWAASVYQDALQKARSDLQSSSAR